MKLKKIFLGCAAVLLSASSAFAGGYQLNLQGIRNIGMGHTGVGMSYDASSVFFNPGALSFLKKSNVQASMSFVNSNIKYLGVSPSTYTATTDSPTGTPFQVYGAYKINDKLTASLGVYVPFGSTVSWGNAWSGRFSMVELSLANFVIQPTLSYQITEQLGVGAGLCIALGNVNLQRSIPVNFTDGTEGLAELDGSASPGFGFNAGVYYRPADVVSIGVSYRSRIDLSVEGGDATFTVPDAVRPNFPNTTFDSQLPLPAVANLGIGIYPTEKLTLAVDVNMTFWSAYESLKFEYAEPVAGSNVTEAIRNYDDALTFRLGAEYELSELIDLRAGFYYDQTPVPDGYMTPETPDANQIGLSCGFGIKPSENLEFNASFLYVDRAKRENTAAEDANTISGTFKANAFIPGVGLSYSF
jgi:long-chain fatty acid transport protein